MKERMAVFLTILAVTLLGTCNDRTNDNGFIPEANCYRTVEQAKAAGDQEDSACKPGWED